METDNSREFMGKLPYSIHSCSSNSINFFPENILVDNPDDESSRWSGESNNSSQFIMLELEQASAVRKFLLCYICSIF
jgi:hypothetical protein